MILHPYLLTIRIDSLIHTLKVRISEPTSVSSYGDSTNCDCAITLNDSQPVLTYYQSLFLLPHLLSNEELLWSSLSLPLSLFSSFLTEEPEPEQSTTSKLLTMDGAAKSLLDRSKFWRFSRTSMLRPGYGEELEPPKTELLEFDKFP